MSSIVFADETIVKIIKTRNAIVHTGQSAGRREIWPKIVFIRELISHVIFRAIRYSGPYQSYIGGYQMVYPKMERSKQLASTVSAVGAIDKLPPT